MLRLGRSATVATRHYFAHQLRAGPLNQTGQWRRRRLGSDCTLHLPQRDGDALHDALRARLGDLPPELRRSITWDQGTEMARHLTIAQKLGAPVYFCDSRSPWQRGSNENTNGLLRDYFPKGTDLRVHPAEHLLAVENELNNRPRNVLNHRSPEALFEALLRSTNLSLLRR